MYADITMEKQTARHLHLLRRIISEQRAATEELRSTNRELEAMLEEVLAGRSDLRKTYEEVQTVDEPPDPPRMPREVELARLERDATKSLEKTRETIREAMLLRLRSKRLRTALRAPATHRAKPHSNLPVLSKRERQVLGLIVEGKSSKEIAAELGISFKTAVTHRASIMVKLDVHEIAS